MFSHRYYSTHSGLHEAYPDQSFLFLSLCYSYRKPSEPPRVAYNSSLYYKMPSNTTLGEEIGPVVSHRYKIYNSNKFSIYTTKVFIDWPYRIHGELDIGGRCYNNNNIIAAKVMLLILTLCTL